MICIFGGYLFYSISVSFSTTKGYPLKIEASNVIVVDSPVDSDLLVRLLPKLNYPALVGALQEIKGAELNVQNLELPEIPPELPENGTGSIDDAAAVEALYQVLFNIHVIEGFLICPDTGRKFPVKNGIPNMILHEDEI
jgi:multifunctional methyltransferase subunit TRM112